MYYAWMYSRLKNEYVNKEAVKGVFSGGWGGGEKKIKSVMFSSLTKLT